MEAWVRDNYVSAVREGSQTWAGLRATAVRNGWREIVELCDEHMLPEIETTAFIPPETAVRRHGRPRKMEVPSGHPGS